MSELPYGVKMTTGRSVSELEEWLNTNCRGEWELECVGLTDDLSRKHLVVQFDTDSDRQNFKAYVAKRGSQAA